MIKRNGPSSRARTADPRLLFCASDQPCAGAPDRAIWAAMATTLTAAMDDFQRCIEERDRARAEQILDDDATHGSGNRQSLIASLLVSQSNSRGFR
jgi:hypothetical protein